MTHLMTMTAVHALGRMADWQTALRAENKSPGTIFIYADGATRYLRWCADGDLLPMSRASLNSWIAELLDAGSSPGTARIRQLAVRRFASWLTAGGEIHADPFPGIKAPRYEPPLVESLTDNEFRALIATCADAQGAAVDRLRAAPLLWQSAARAARPAAEHKSLGQLAGRPLPLFVAGSMGPGHDARTGRTSDMGMRLIHAVASRNATRALDAAHLRSTVAGYEPCFETKGQWLPSQLEPPM